MAYLMDRINEQLAKAGYDARTRQARDWLRLKVGELKPTPQKLMQDKLRQDELQFCWSYVFFLL